MANRLSPYAGTASGSNSRYQVTQEITDAILEFDSIIVQARISTPGDPYRNNWMSVSADIASGALIPPHIGAIVGLQVKVGSVYTDARFASSRAEILAMRAHPTLYPDAANWGFIEAEILYHNGDFGRVWRSTFTKSTVCQSPEQDELGVIAGAIGSLTKDGAVTPEIYSAGAQYAQWYINSQIKGQNVDLPEVEQIESRLAA
jgi:hypothetical protein